MLADQIDMRALRQRVHARISPPGAVYGDPLAAEFCEGVLQRCLHRDAFRLALPADQAAAVVLERQLVAGHGSIVPAGSAKPRSSASASIAPRPARWTRSGRSTRSPQAMDRRSSSTVPGVPVPGMTVAESTRMRS